MAHTTELADVEQGKDAVVPCGCGHETCREPSKGTPERGMA